MSRAAAMLSRWRVRLGFLVAVVTLWLAAPTPLTLALGAAVACIGEVVRIWAAGHLEKSREITKSGPYRLTRHPLYVGSAVMGTGVVIASNSLIIGASVLVYLVVTLTAAIRQEEAYLRAQFGAEYDTYADGTSTRVERPFSLQRAWRNREYRAAIGLLAMVAILAAKTRW